jgi:hypothetical protein
MLLLSPASVTAAPAEIEHAVRSLDRAHDQAVGALHVLRSGGAPAAEAIHEAWPSLSLLARKRVVGALQSLAKEHDTAVLTLAAAAKSDDGQLRELALAALRRAGPRGREGLVALLGDANVGDRAASLLARIDPDQAIWPLLRAMVAKEGAGPRALRDALAVAVQRAARPRARLEAWLKSAPPPDAVASAAQALSALESHGDIVATLVEHALPGSSDFVTSWRLLRSAESAGPSDAIDRWVTRQLAESSEWMLRAAAIDAITARGSREQARRSLADPYPRVRLRAAEALSGDPASLVDRATLARRDRWPMVRASAVRSLRTESEAIAVIVAAVDDPMSIVREAAIEVLAEARHERGWDRVHRRLRDSSEWPSVTAAAIAYVVAHCRTDAAESLFGVVLRATPSHALTEELNNAAHAIEALRALGTAESQAVIARLRKTPGVPPTLKIALDRPLDPGAACTAPGT